MKKLNKVNVSVRPVKVQSTTFSKALTPAVIQDTKQTKRTWSPARREAQELRQLRKAAGTDAGIKKAPRTWSEARREAQIRAKQEREIQKATAVALESKDPLVWSPERWEAPRNKTKQPIVIDVEAEEVTITYPEVVTVTPAAANLLGTKIGKKCLITNIEKKEKINQKRYAARAGFCFLRFSTPFRKAKKQRLATVAMKKIKRLRRSRQRTSIIFRFARAVVDRKERYSKKLHRAWQRQCAVAKRKRKAYILKKRKKDSAFIRIQRYQRTGVPFITARDLKIMKRRATSRLKRWLKKSTPWHLRWALYIAYRLRKRVRILDRLNLLLRDTLYFNYIHPMEEWDQEGEESDEGVSFAGLFIDFLSVMSTVYIDEYGLQKRPYKFVIGGGCNEANEIFSPGDNYWKPDGFTDEDIDNFTDDELSYYAQGALGRIKKRERRVVLVIPPTSCVKRLRLTTKRKRPRKNWRALCRIDLFASLLKLLEARADYTNAAPGTARSDTEDFCSPPVFLMMHFDSYLIYWADPRPVPLMYGRYLATVFPFISKISPLMQCWNKYVHEVYGNRLASFYAAADSLEDFLMFLRNLETAEIGNTPASFISEFAKSSLLNWWAAPRAFSKDKETHLTSFLIKDVHPHQKLDKFVGARPNNATLVAASMLRLFGFQGASSMSVRQFSFETSQPLLIAEHGTFEECLDTDTSFFETMEQQEAEAAAARERLFHSIDEAIDECLEEIAAEHQMKEEKRVARAAARELARRTKPDGWSPARRLAHETAKARRAVELAANYDDSEVS